MEIQRDTERHRETQRQRNTKNDTEKQKETNTETDKDKEIFSPLSKLPGDKLASGSHNIISNR